MAAGLFGYLGYDMVRLIERLPDENPDMLGIPDAILMRPTIIAVFDGIQNQITLVTPVWPASGMDADSAYDLALERIGDAISDLEREPALPARSRQCHPFIARAGVEHDP